ncbi:MAG: FAD-dependent oxidoreductase [Alphaproteobacteria bacterium]|nr:FAD-dependent oxidoreductase [Alphaproteobacteria bacterium]
MAPTPRSSRAPRTTHQVAVIGAGIAGMAAATEAARCGLKTALFDDGLLGGLIINVNAIHGHPGAIDTTGADLVNTMLGEALEAGVDYQPGAVSELTAANDHWSLPANSVTARRVILATGADLRTLGVPGEEQLTGRGVSQCAYCDGGLYKGKDVAVVGGGDGAFQEALHLTELCASVTMILRSQKPRARPVFVRQAADLSNMHFRWNTEVQEIIGTDGVDTVRLIDSGGKEETLPIAAIFPFIGLTPKTALTNASKDDAGALIIDSHLQTDQPGLYAIGATRAGYGGQIAHAIADGKVAAQAAWRSI